MQEKEKGEEKKKEGERQLSRLGPEPRLPWSLNTALPFSLLKDREGLSKVGLGRWSRDVQRPTSASHLDPTRADLYAQAFSPDPQSIQNKLCLFIRSCKSMQTSAVLLGCVGPRRHQGQTGGGRGWRRGEDSGPLALTWRGLGEAKSTDLPGPSPEAVPRVLVTWSVCPSRI